jgi:hypothetical protein
MTVGDKDGYCAMKSSPLVMGTSTDGAEDGAVTSDVRPVFPSSAG